MLVLESGVSRERRYSEATQLARGRELLPCVAAHREEMGTDRQVAPSANLPTVAIPP